MLAAKLLSVSAALNIEYIGTTENNVTSSNTFSIAYPSGTQVGDLALIFITASNSFGNDFVATGWTVVDRDTSVGSVKSQVSRITVSSLGSQSFTKTGSTSNSVAYSMVVFRKAVFGAFAKATNTTTAAAVDPPSISGTFDAFLVSGHIDNSGAYTAPTDFTLIGNVAGTAIRTVVADRIASVSNYNPGAFSGTNALWVTYTIGLTKTA